MTNKLKIKNWKLRIARGFTLIETLLAILLLSTAIVGPLTIASKGLSSSLVAKDQVSAFFLAQDAVEYVRFKRDSNKLNPTPTPWLTGLVGSGLCSSDGATTCYADSIQDTVAACSGACPALNYDTTNRYFTYSVLGGSIQATPERYIRTIKLTTPVGNNASEAALQVTVAWTGAGGISHNVVVRENLYDW